MRSHPGLSYSQRLVSKSFASSALRHLCRLLELPASGWKRAADELPLSDSEECQKVLKHWSAGPRESLDRFTLDDGGDLCIHELFEHRRRGDPFAKAIVSGDVDRVPTVLTYAAMDAWACSLALQLRRRGVGRGDLVALLFERCPAMVVAIYAVLKARGDRRAARGSHASSLPRSMRLFPPAAPPGVTSQVAVGEVCAWLGPVATGL